MPTPLLIWGVPLFLLLMTASFIVWIGYRDYEDTVAEEYRVLDITTLHAETQCAAALRAIDLLLQEIAADRLATPHPEAFRQSLQTRLAQYPEIRSLSATDAAGHIAVSSDPRLIGFDAAGREYFSVHSNSSASALHVAHPFTTITGITTIALSRPIRDTNGRLIGVAVATLAPAYFENVLRSILPPGDSQALLINRAGQVLWGLPNPEQLAAKSLAETSGFREHLAAATPLSHHNDTDENDNSRHIQAFQRVGDSGLIVVITQDIEKELNAWRRATLIHALLFLLAVATTLYLARFTRRSHQRLADAKYFSERIIETANVMVVGIDGAGRIRIFNAAAENISGYHRDEVFAASGFDLSVLDQFAGLPTDSAPHSFDSSIVTKDGREKFISWQGSRIAEPGSTLAAVYFGIDITERKQAEADLRRLIEESPLPMLVSRGKEQRLELLNQRFTQSIGYTAEDIPDIAHWRMLAYPDALYRQQVVSAWTTRIEDAIQNSTDMAPVETRIACKNGEERIFDCYVTQIGDRRLVVFVDLTEKRHVESRLAETLEFSESIIAESPSGVTVFRSDGQCIMANEAAAHILGGTREEMLKQNYRRLPSWRTSGLLDAALDTLAFGKPMRKEAHLTTSFGKEMWIECRMTKLIWNGQPHLLVVAADVSEFRLAEQALQQATQIAESASRMKSDFLANMSHEIRTPMNAIIGLSQLALGDATEPKLRDQLQKIFSASSALLRLLNDILDSSRIEAGRLKIEATDFFIHDVVNNTINLLSAVADAKGIALASDIAADVPTHLKGDPLRLGQVLTNLVGNAVKFTEQGSISIAVRALEAAAGKTRLSFAVIDTGIGMNEDQLSTIFQPFVQADGSITRRFGGSGLGLTITRGLLHLMGGDVAVTSRSGEGSRFSFELEFGLAPTPATVQLPAPDSRPLAVTATAIAGARVLLVEDDLVNQQVARAFLLKAGIEVSVANNGKEALALLEQEEFDAVLMDLQMPVMDGFETAHHIRACKRWQHLPIIAVTASAMLQDRDECLAAGMNEHIAKPINPQRLIEVLLRFIPARQQGLFGDGTPTDSARTAALVRELDVQLRQHEFIAPENLVQLRMLLAASPEPLRQMELAISRYDYGKARLALAEAARALRISLEQDS